MSFDEIQHIVRMWNRAYPKSLLYDDATEFEKYLKETKDKLHYISTDRSEEVDGWLMTFEREESTWFAILVKPIKQRSGIGTKLLQEAKKNNTVLHGWAIDRHDYVLQNGEAYISPISFYLKHGFEVIPEKSIVNEKLSAVKISWFAHSVTENR